MNFNTVAGYIGGTGRNQIASQTLASTTETEFAINNDSGTSVAVIAPPGQGDIIGSQTPLGVEANPAYLISRGRPAAPRGGTAPWFNSASFDVARPFKVRVAGVITPVSNAANTLTLKIYLGATKAGTAIASTGAMTGTQSSTQAGAFVFEALLVWDSVGQIIGGQQWWSVVAGATPNYNTWKALTANPTGVTLANLKFCASAQWGNAVGGVIAVSEFSLSQE